MSTWPPFLYALLFFLLLGSLGAFANTYYVRAGANGGAGTEANPWPTVQQAADVAVAGDTVIIEDGSYPENVVVKHSGAKDHSIAFRARHNRKAILYSIVPAWTPGGRNGLWTSSWVALQGIDFNSPASNGLHGVQASTGWDIEDCTIEGYSELGMHGEMAVNMGDITVRHCVFQDCHASSFGGYSGLTTPADLLHDVLVQNCVVRRSNLSNVTNTGWDGGVNKFFNSRNVTVDGVIAYDNNGPAIWFDTNNQNFAVINCTIFGNHSGFFYNPSDHKIWDNSTCSFAIDTEANQGPGLISNNVLYSNQVGRGVVQACSGNGYGVTGSHLISITHNIFADNQYQIYYWSQVGPEPTRGLGDTLVVNNTFYGWNWLAVQGGGTTGPPGHYGIIQGHNIYAAGISSSAIWGQWDFFPKVQAKSLAEMQSLLHLEDGTSSQQSLGPFPGQLPAGSIYVSPTQAQVQANGSNPTPAVSELTTPTSSIDSQLSSLPSDRTISAPVTVTAFGHTPLVATGSGYYSCELYDLQGRWVSLTVPAEARAEFEKLILPYATLTGTNVKIKVTWKSAYRVSAQFLGNE